MSTIRTKSIPIVVCLAFGLAACGSDSKSEGTTTVAVATTVADTTPDTTPDTTAAPDTTVPATSATDAPDTSVEEAFELVDTTGDYLTDSSGMMLYVFTQDPFDVSTCYDACATTWPPVLVPEGDFLVSMPEGFDQIPRDDGLGQLTWLHQPLYRYSGDSAPGDRNGDTIGGVWFVVPLVGG
ncbi:MAG: hypothetical protein K8R99_01600 [Actinomycetia bacterium]|nr:hypothetical protein [Actinomycetes bacterium]